MAYVSKALKKELAPGIRRVLKKYRMKGTISVNMSHTQLRVTLWEGPLFADMWRERRNNSQEQWLYWSYSVPSGAAENDFWQAQLRKAGLVGDDYTFICELGAAMDAGNHNSSDIMSDYFDVGWYSEIAVGRYERNYVCSKQAPRKQAQTGLKRKKPNEQQN